MKIEFLMCGSPNDAFYSQAAIYRYFLDSFGGHYRQARLVLCLADHERKDLPARWHPYFRNIEIHWASRESFLQFGDGGDHVYTLLDPDADLSFICDADTLLVRPFAEDFLPSLLTEPAIRGVIAHYRPAPNDAYGHDYSTLPNDTFWAAISRHVLGRTVPLDNRYTLLAHPDRCPFYINYGFVAGPPALLTRLHAELSWVQPRIRQFLDNDYYGQIGIALAVERGRIPAITLPMRYNFPNDPIADAKYADELEQVRVIHYLRTAFFDRHRIFTDRKSFGEFLALGLSGSNAVFQTYVRQTTSGVYPFE